jgi:Substrate binding domain of ABC-type glycine betaine transport system
VILADDKQLQNAANLVPIVNSDWLKDNEDAAKALNELSAVLTTEDLTTMIGKVDIDRQKAADVAQAYLKDKGLILDPGPSVTARPARRAPCAGRARSSTSPRAPRRVLAPCPRQSGSTCSDRRCGASEQRR